MVRPDASVPNQNCGEVDLFGQFASLARSNGGEHGKQVGKFNGIVLVDIRWVARIETPVRQYGQEVREFNHTIPIHILWTSAPGAAGAGEADPVHGELNEWMVVKQ